MQLFPSLLRLLRLSLSGEIYLCQPTSKLHDIFALNVQVLLFRAALGGLVPGWGK